MREVLPDAELLPRYFSRHGYRSAGSGKILHYFIDAPSWDDCFPAKSSANPLPRTLYPDKRPVNLPRGGPWQYEETDWGPLDATDEAFGGDWLVSKWVGEQLARKHDKPFFLACGIYRPHEPWFVPQKYFDQFPLDKIQLPPGYLENDLADLPSAGQKRGPNRYFAHIRAHDQWKRGIQGYLASIALPMPWWAACPRLLRTGRIATTPWWCCGAIMAGTWGRRSTGRSTLPGGHVPGFL